MPNRVIVLVDGFNLYHALKGDKRTASKSKHKYNWRRYHKYKWLDVKKIAECFLQHGDEVTASYYFTAVHWGAEKAARHRHYIDALQAHSIETIEGEFKRRDITCRAEGGCGRVFVKREEKKTDVNIATFLLGLASEDAFDKVVLISGDNDLIPAIDWLKRLQPEKKLHVIIPISRYATDDLKDTLHMLGYTYSVMKEKHLKKSQMPNRIELDDKTILNPYQSNNEE